MRWLAIAGVLFGLVGFGTALGALSAAHGERDRVTQHETRMASLHGEIETIRKQLDELKTGQPRQTELVTGLQTRLDTMQRTIGALAPLGPTVAQLQREVADLKLAAAPPPAPVEKSPSAAATPASQPTTQATTPKKADTPPKKAEPGKPTKTPKKTPK